MKTVKTHHLHKIMLLYRIIDMLVVIFSWSLAYYIRFHILKNGENIDMRFISMSIPLIIITFLYFSHNDLYTSQRYFSWYREVFAVFKSHFQSVATFVIFLYFLLPNRLSRITIILYSVIVVIFSLVSRLIFKSVLENRRRHGKDLRKIILIGNNKPIREYAERIKLTPELGLKVIGWVGSNGISEKFGVPEIKNIQDIPLESGNEVPDAVIMGFNPEDYTEQNNALSYFNKTIMPVWILPEIEHTFIGYTIESFHGLPLINVNGNKLTTVETIIKRLTDITGSTLALILFSPVMAVIALLIKISSPGPVFYGQERVTLNGKIFTMWKFRSMKVNAEKETGAVWTKKNDDRTTKIGAFIRKTSLDELPQFWNILKGEMSLIGPRPERPVFVEQFKKEIPSYMLRHKMKSGLTGWAQVNGWRGDTSLERRIEFDLYYIQNWSIFLDVKILFLTLINGFVNTNAY